MADEKTPEPGTTKNFRETTRLVEEEPDPKAPETARKDKQPPPQTRAIKETTHL